MPKQQIDLLVMTSAVAILCLAWCMGAIEAGYHIRQGAQFQLAIQHTFLNPWIAVNVVLAVAIVFYLIPIAYDWLDDGYRGEPFIKHLRGTKIANWHWVNLQVQDENRKRGRIRRKQCAKEKIPYKPIPPIKINEGLAFPTHLEGRHTLTCASIGSGKSVCMEYMLFHAKRRGDRNFIVDPNGSFFAKFANPKRDHVLNPWLECGIGWSIFNEIQGPFDFERVTKSVIPPQPSQDAEDWCGYARIILESGLRRYYMDRVHDQRRLVDMLMHHSKEDIRDVLQGTDAIGLFEKDAERMTASIKGVLTKYIRPLRLMRPGSFSITKWVQQQQSGDIYLPWREDMKPSMLPLVGMWTDMLFAATLSSPPKNPTPLNAFLDELYSLGIMQYFEDAAGKGRKHELHIYACIQDWAQISKTYGQLAERIILGCFRNYIILGASTARNAHIASEIIGNQQVQRWHITESLGAGRSGRSRSKVTHNPEPVVLDSEISNLKDLEGYVMFAENFPVCKIKLDLLNLPTRNGAFTLRHDADANAEFDEWARISERRSPYFDRLIR